LVIIDVSDLPGLAAARVISARVALEHALLEPYILPNRRSGVEQYESPYQ
jgi:hypothetical protein